MQKITFSPTDIIDGHVGDYDLQPQYSNLCSYYSIPSTILSVDKKFGTDCFGQVLRSAAPSIEAVTDDESGAIHVLDPRSHFYDDDEFNGLQDLLAQATGAVPVHSSTGFSSTFSLDIPLGESDEFLGDSFSRNISVQRLPQGGLSFNVGLMRLACSNGMKVADKQFSHHLRTGLPEHALVTALYDAAGGLNLAEYFASIFTKDGQPIGATVGEVKDMAGTLAQLTSKEYSELLYPLGEIKSVYGEQGIDIDKLSRRMCDKLPSGLSYYESFNILTHGAKLMSERTLENEVMVARFCAPRRMDKLKDVAISYDRAPVFDSQRVHSWMGDHSALNV